MWNSYFLKNSVSFSLTCGFPKAWVYTTKIFPTVEFLFLTSPNHNNEGRGLVAWVKAFSTRVSSAIKESIFKNCRGAWVAQSLSVCLRLRS